MRLCAEGGLLLVLSLAVPPDENHVDETGTPAADNGDLGRLVARRVFGPEGLRSCVFPGFRVSGGSLYAFHLNRGGGFVRTNDVTSAVGDEIDGGYSSLLRVTGHIGGDEREQGDERGRTGLGEVIADETAEVVRERQGDDENHAEHGNDQTRTADQDSVAEFVTEIPA